MTDSTKPTKQGLPYETNFFGWFEAPKDYVYDQTPKHDPGTQNLACPYCGNQMHAHKTAMLTLLIKNKPGLYFFRTHKDCNEKATHAQRAHLMDAAKRLLEHKIQKDPKFLSPKPQTRPNQKGKGPEPP